MYKTTSRFHQPNGASNQLIGIHPHIEVYPKETYGLVVIREDDDKFNPVAASGKAVKPVLKSSTKTCMDENSQAEKDYKKEGVVKSHDFQLLVAKDLAACL